VGLSVLGQAAGMFAVTNIDDLLVLAVFFGQAAGHRAAVWRVVAGQYLGFLAILVASVVGALGAGLLPESVIPYLGLLPLALGIKAAWQTWKHRHDPDDETDETRRNAGMLQVAAVTFAIFLIGVAVWCAAGWFLASRPVVAKALSRWGHIVLPVVLIGIGLVILVEGL
jgi:cadmium resistance protein CadD (predicted permease)